MKKVFFVIVALVGFVFGNSLEEIRNSGVVRIGVYANSTPFSKQIESGSFEGFEIDIANALAKKLFPNGNGKIEFVPIELDGQRVEFLQQNRVDAVIANYTITPAREKLVDFSMPYFAVNAGVLTKASDNVKSLKDLHNRTILVKEGTTTDKFLIEGGFKTKYCENAKACFQALKNGEGDAYAADNTIVLNLAIIDHDFEVGLKALGETFFIGMAVSEGNKDLLKAVNQALIELSKEGFFKDSFQNTINVFYKGTADQKYFLLEDIYAIFG